MLSVLFLSFFFLFLGMEILVSEESARCWAANLKDNLVVILEHIDTFHRAICFCNIQIVTFLEFKFIMYSKTSFLLQ